MMKLIYFCFKGEEKQFIAVAKFGAPRTDNTSTFKITFNKTSSKLAINFFPDNRCFNFGSLSFKQIICIPMDSDPETFFAKMFLYHYKNKWLEIYVKHAFLVTHFIL